MKLSDWLRKWIKTIKWCSSLPSVQHHWRNQKYSAITVEPLLKGSITAYKGQIPAKNMEIRTKLVALEERNTDTLDFNKHRVTCKMSSPQAMKRMEKMSLKMKRNVAHHSPHLEIRVLLSHISLKRKQENKNMNFNNIICIVFNNRKIITFIIIIFKKTILEFIWMEFFRLAIFQDSSSLHFNILKLKQILLIMFSNSKIKTFILNKMINRNINQTLKEKMDLLAVIKFRKTKTLIRKMKKNHLEFHWSPQKRTN